MTEPYQLNDLTDSFWQDLEDDRKVDQLYWNEEFLSRLRATIDAQREREANLEQNLAEVVNLLCNYDFDKDSNQSHAVECALRLLRDAAPLSQGKFPHWIHLMLDSIKD